MTETVVHVTTLEQWKSVLDVWFKQGYEWNSNNQDSQQGRFKNYHYEAFRDGCRQLAVSDKKMATVYEVSQSVFDELQRIRAHEGTSLIGAITLNAQLIKSIEIGNKAILRYLADDPTIDFKVKEPLYRLGYTQTEVANYFDLSTRKLSTFYNKMFKNGVLVKNTAKERFQMHEELIRQEDRGRFNSAKLSIAHGRRKA